MDTQAVAQRMEIACEELGLDPESAHRMIGQILRPELVEAAHRQQSLVDENVRLCSELQRIREERDQALAIQREIMQLLEVKSPGQIIHNLRNVLNECVLLRTLLPPE
jgi:hypothetical protein